MEALDWIIVDHDQRVASHIWNPGGFQQPPQFFHPLCILLHMRFTQILDNLPDFRRIRLFGIFRRGGILVIRFCAAVDTVYFKQAQVVLTLRDLWCVRKQKPGKERENLLTLRCQTGQTKGQINKQEYTGSCAEPLIG